MVTMKETSPPKPDINSYGVDMNPKKFVPFHLIISISDAARRIDVNPMTVWHWVQQGKLPAHQLGRTTLVSFADVRQVNLEILRTRKIHRKSFYTRSPKLETTDENIETSPQQPEIEAAN